MTRGMDERRRHGWPFRFVVMFIVLPALYVASFGPACWLLARRTAPTVNTASMIAAGKSAERLPFRAIYWPMGWMIENGPEYVHDSLRWYATIRDAAVYVPTDPTGNKTILLLKQPEFVGLM